MKKVPIGANHFIGWQKPRDNTCKEAHDAQEKENAHGLITIEGSVTHLDEDVDEHPEADAGAEDGHSHDDEGPGSADE